MTGRCSTDQDANVLAGLISAWPVATSGQLRPTSAGTNNRSHFVDTPTGSYVLRIYQNTNDPDRIRYEHALLRQLPFADLSFDVPLPLAADTGDTFVVAGDDGTPIVAALFAVIPGREPQRGNVADAMACGQALGELDAALARVAVESTFPGPPWFGEPSSPAPAYNMAWDSIEAGGEFSIIAGKRQVLHRLLNHLIEHAPELYARLPHQIIHADFYPSNVLMCGSRVSGILDFEFASPGPRAMDVAIGLGAFGISMRQPDNDWKLLDAFAAGYRRRIALTAPEIDALPDLLRLREATSLAHWVERHGRGLTTEHDIVRRVERLLDVSQWMTEHGDNLIEYVAQAAR